VTSTFDLGGTKTYRALQKQMPKTNRRTLRFSVNGVSMAIVNSPAPEPGKSSGVEITRFSSALDDLRLGTAKSPKITVTVVNKKLRKKTSKGRMKAVPPIEKLAPPREPKTVTSLNQAMSADPTAPKTVTSLNQAMSAEPPMMSMETTKTSRSS
jgi:hypothetical protein